MDSTNPVTRDYAVQLAAQYPGDYTIDQVCSIWDTVYSKWRYVSDPAGNDYYASASESITNNLAGDCDDFAIEVASLIEAIGGGARVIGAYNTTSSSHAYPEVYIGPKGASLTNEIIQDLANKYSSVIWYEIDSNDKVWLNLDWSAQHLGGPFFTAQQYFAFRSSGYWESFTPSPTSIAPSIIKHTQVVANGIANPAGGGYSDWDFTAVSGSTLTGSFTSAGGSGYEVFVYVLDDVSLTNFKALKGTPTLYNSGQVSKGDFQVTFTNAGTYHIVVDNMFNRISGKSVTVYATLEWETPV
jgi:Transglutaminase-like superfamily